MAMTEKIAGQMTFVTDVTVTFPFPVTGVVRTT